MKKLLSLELKICPDCGKETTQLTSQGICEKCRVRKTNAKARHTEYVPYKDLPEDKKAKIDKLQATFAKKSQKQEEIELPVPKLPVVDHYYQAKAEQTDEVIEVEAPIITTTPINPLSNKSDFLATIKNCGYNIDPIVIDTLLATDKLKDILTPILENTTDLSNVETILNECEKILQNNWECNGFQVTDEIKFKAFLTWRRTLKESLAFWKQFSSTNVLADLQKVLGITTPKVTPTTAPVTASTITPVTTTATTTPVTTTATTTPVSKITKTNETTSKKTFKPILSKYQITTETISTIYNTRKPFTRVFYAQDMDMAYTEFVKWISDRQLHENRNKTTIIKLDD